MRLALLIPVFNEGSRLDAFLSELDAFVGSGALGPLTYERIHVVVVDDGSARPVTLSPLAAAETHLLRHAVNLGQGAALQTAVDYARDVLECDEFVTMDSDGQHRPQDLPALLAPLRQGKDIVFGNRFAAQAPAGIPRSRRLILRLAALFERVVTGVRVGDAHNGCRAFNRRFASHLDLKQNRMAHATEFKQTAASAGAVVGEVPVSVQYTDAALAKGQRNVGTFAILKDLLASYLFDR